MAISLRTRSADSLSGRQKAAVLCLALGSDVAAKITQKMTPEEVEALSFEIARLDRVNSQAVEDIMEEWLTEMLAAETLATGGIEAAREILERALGPRKAAQVLERIQGHLAENAGLYRLRNADPQQLGTMLRGEHPQTAALILSHLEPQHTAAVLKEIEHDTGAEVVYRMAKMEKVSPELLQLIERSISAETDLSMTKVSTAGGPAVVANVLNFVPGSLEKALLDGVEQRDAELSTQIKNLMFVFEDISTLDDRSLQRVLRDVDTKELALALKAASAPLKTKILAAMSQRAQQSLNDEIEMLGPVRMRDVESAQSSIVGKVRALEEAGEIVMSGGDDDVVL